jgi:hypothetical protein
LSSRLRGWRWPLAGRDPGKIVLNLALVVAPGGAAAGDIAVLRAQPRPFGLVASDATVSRLVAALAEDVDAALVAITSARAVARERVWGRVGVPLQEGLVVIDLEATLITAHLDKEQASATGKKTFGFPPSLAYADHGAGGGGEPVGELLRPGNAGSNTAADHVTVLQAALAQLPSAVRTLDEQGRIPVLVHTDAAGATHSFAAHLAARGIRFSLGANLGHFDIATALRLLPESAWTPAYQATKPRAGQSGRHIEARDGAWVAELTGLANLSAWPAGTRLILRRERVHPGAQLRITVWVPNWSSTAVTCRIAGR